MERMTAAEFRELMDKPKSKYRAKKMVIDGIKFDSQLEAKHYCELMILVRTGEVTNLELQPRFPLLDATKESRGITYVADFLVTYKDGRQEVVDCKGMRTQVYRMKKKMFHERYPHLTIKEVT